MLMNDRIIRRVLMIMIASLAVVSCSSHRTSKKTQEPVGPNSGSEGKDDSGATSLTSERRLLINSISNNPLTSRAVDRSRAADFVGQQGGGRSKDINTLAASVSAHRLAGRGVNEAMVDAKVIADLEMAKGVERDIPELVQLELGLTGVQTGRLAFAEFWLDKLLKSKSSFIRASAINAKGVMAVRMDRIPEAVVMFKEALAVTNDYKPALLNIGFLALQGGDAVTAKKAFDSMQDDWYVQSAFVSVLRLEGDVERADSICEQILAKRPKHKPTLINCGINAWQGKRDFKKARDLINRSLAVAGGLPVWDEKSGRLLGAIDAEESRMNHAKAQKDLEDRKAKEDAEKAKSAAAQPEATKGSGAQPATESK
jgi:hypothetical protein